jgi:hypothetical protein
VSKKVYVLNSWYGYEGETLIGVFSCQKKAEFYRDLLIKKHPTRNRPGYEGYEIYEKNLDELLNLNEDSNG